MSNWKYTTTKTEMAEGFPYFLIYAHNALYRAIAEIHCGGTEESPNTIEVVLGITIDSDDDVSPLTVDAFLLRDLPLTSLLAQARMELAGHTASVTDGDTPNFRELANEWPKGDIDEVARWAGHIYLSAIRDGIPANKAVQDAYGMTRSTAQRVIKRARTLGHIPEDIVAPPTHGQGVSTLKVVK